MSAMDSLMTTEKLIEILSKVPADTLVSFGKDLYLIREVQVNVYPKGISVTLNPNQKL